MNAEWQKLDNGRFVLTYTFEGRRVTITFGDGEYDA